MTAFGNAVIGLEAASELSWRGVHFTGMPLKECYFELDHRGDISHFYRELMWTPQEVYTKFGDKTPEDIIKRADRAEQERLVVIFCLYVEPKNNQRPVGQVTVANRPVQGRYVIAESAEVVGDPVGYYEMPVFFPRWRRAVGSTWGYGPGHLALPTVLTLNQLKQIILEAAEKVIDPALLVTERGVIGDIDLRAGGITVVKDTDSIVPLESRSRVDVSQLEVEKLQRSVRDLFRMNQLELQQGPQMTATEVEVRYELMHRLLGPTLGRIRTDMLDKLISRIFAMLGRAGLLPPPPDSVRSVPSDYDIHYLGPLARAQKMDKVMAIQRWVQMAAEMTQGGIRNADIAVRGDEVMRHTAREMSIPPSLTRGGDETEYLQQLEQQIEQMAQQMQALGDMMQQGGDENGPA